MIQKFSKLHAESFFSCFGAELTIVRPYLIALLASVRLFVPTLGQLHGTVLSFA